MLCRGVPDEMVASEIADRVSAAVAKPVMLDDGEVYVTASVGIALSSGDLETPETLLRNADAAMYAAKDLGRARVELYDAGSRDRAVKHLRTGNDLHRALERGEMCVYYQPIMSLETAAHRRFRSARSLAASGARARGSRPVHRSRRGDRADRAHRRVGARRGLPPSGGVARARRAHHASA